MKNVIITGSSKGFGYLAAKDFAKKGYKVWATMRDSDTKNSAAKKELEDFSDSIRVEDMDVADDTSVTNCVEKIICEEKKIDVLINNAGIMYSGITEAFSVEQAHQQMNTNYYGIIRTTQAVLPSMRQAKSGLIINCSSQLGRVSFPFMGTYCATKFAVEAYSQTLRYELSPFGIEVTLLEPGPFSTNLINSGAPESRTEILDQYKTFKEVQNNMMTSFSQLLESDERTNPQLVVDRYLELAETDRGNRPARLTVGMDWGATKINDLTQPIQDSLIEEYQLDTVFAPNF